MPRPSKDDLGMGLAREIAQQSRCDKNKVGAAIASSDFRHWALGYNGPPAGFDPLTVERKKALPLGCSAYCPQGAGTEGWCVSVHAEVNAIAQSDRASREGGTFYVTTAPCLKCMLVVMNSGVSRLVCPPWAPGRGAESSQVDYVLSHTNDFSMTIWRPRATA